MNLNNKTPIISVLMANYNKDKYVSQAIASVLDQTFNDWELIIYDDNSSDDSIKIIEKYLTDKRIRFFKGEKNTGKINVLRQMIDLSNADILLILDSDDVLCVDALDLVNKAFLVNNDHGFVYSQFVFCDENLKETERGLAKQIPTGKSCLHDDYVWALRSYRKGIYKKTEGYTEDILYAEDRDIIYKLEEVTKFFFIDKVLYKYRRVPNSQTLDPEKIEIGRSACVLAKYNAFLRRQNKNIPNLNRREMSSELLKGLPSCLKSKDYIRARLFFFSSLRLSPFNIVGYFYLLFRMIKLPFYRAVRFFYPGIENLYKNS